MMGWDSCFKVANPHKEAISLLCQLYKSKVLLERKDEIIPSNRLYVLIELELFYEWLPSSLIPKTQRVSWGSAESAGFPLASLDNQSWAFTQGFLRFVLPGMYEALLALKFRSTSASTKQTLDVSAPGASYHTS